MAEARLMHLPSRFFRIESGIIVVLLVMAAVLAVPALRTIRLPHARLASEDITAHVRAVMDRAQTERRPYTITFAPQSGTIKVARLIGRPGHKQPIQEPIANLGWTLPGGVIVVNTSLPTFRLLISEKGYLLSRGRIQLRGADGSRAEWDTEKDL
ncbi:MAG: hypothetical protein ACYC7E_14650 [Armatimonadota bacterium]